MNEIEHIKEMIASVKPDDEIVVWVSAGEASAAAFIRTIELYGAANVRGVYNPVKEEHHDNLRYLEDLGRYTGKEIEIASNIVWPDNSAESVWRKRKFMSGPDGAPCTGELKKEARRQWEDRNSFDGYHVMGFTVDEEHRHKRRVEKGMKLLAILINEGMTKQDCHDFMRKTGIKPPVIYSISSPFGDGFPNANCIGCVKSTSPTYWNHVRCTFPGVFDNLAKLSRSLGAKLVRCHPKYLSFYAKTSDGKWVDERTGFRPYNKKGKFESPRIFLDELPANARGRSMKTMRIECGISCGIDD